MASESSQVFKEIIFALFDKIPYVPPHQQTNGDRELTAKEEVAKLSAEVKLLSVKCEEKSAMEKVSNLKNAYLNGSSLLIKFRSISVFLVKFLPVWRFYAIILSSCLEYLNLEVNLWADHKIFRPYSLFTISQFSHFVTTIHFSFTFLCLRLVSRVCWNVAKLIRTSFKNKKSVIFSSFYHCLIWPFEGQAWF